MNKKYITAIVGATLAVAAAATQAAPTVYGSARVELESCSDCDNSTDDSWTMNNAGSRVGVKGSEDLGGGLSAIYQFEFGVAIDGSTNSLKLDEGGVIDLNGDGDMTDTGVEVKGESKFDPGNRPKWAGLKGEFGQIKFGRQFRPAYDYVGGATDIFNDGELFDLLGFRASDMAYYNSPKFGGFDFGVAGVIGGGTDGKDIDELEVAARFSMGPVTVAAVGASVKNATFGDKQGAVVTYAQGPVEVSLAMHRAEISTSAEEEALILVGQYSFGNNAILAGYGKMETDGVVAEPTTAKVEFQHKLSKATRAWAAYIDADNDDNVDNEEAKFQLGMRVDF